MLPQVWGELQQATHRLEQAFGDMQDFEFTVENGRLWLRQTRDGKRTAQARARIALDLPTKASLMPTKRAGAPLGWTRRRSQCSGS